MKKKEKAKKAEPKRNCWGGLYASADDPSRANQRSRVPGTRLDASPFHLPLHPFRSPFLTFLGHHHHRAS